MFIENISLEACAKGHHYEAGSNSMLIQIVDPDMEFPVARAMFKEVHRFKFLDIEEEHKHAMTDDQAKEIVDLLQKALDNCMNVVVHCHAGICRSGAVAEVGAIMGFQDVFNYRQPNILVKRKLMECLGMTYESKVAKFQFYDEGWNARVDGEEFEPMATRDWKDGWMDCNGASENDRVKV